MGRVPFQVIGEFPLMRENRASDPGRGWMLALKRGEEDAFRNIVQHYGRRIVSFFVRYGADGGTAEDLAQEAFLRIYRARDRYEPTARFSTWLHRILHRLAMNEGTRNRWRRAVSLSTRGDEEESPALPELAEEETEGPAEHLDQQEVRQQVRDAVAALPENQRTALVLNRFQGLSYEEVAEVLEMKIPAVKSLLFRARENVRKQLTPLLQEDVPHESR